jgi:phage baseplate assembly protein W
MQYLSLIASINLTIQQTTANRQGTALIEVTLTDSRPFLPTKHVSLDVDWGDGSLHAISTQQVSPYVDEFEHIYAPGSYTIKLTATNYQLPTAELVTQTFDVVVKTNLPTIPTLEQQGLQPIIFGPILPRESFPNVDDWEWQLATDTIMLESAAKLLLLTDYGERLMTPEFGTKIRQMIFSPSDAQLRDAVSQEINRAFSVNIPDLTVANVDVQGVSSKELTVAVQLISNLDQRKFQVSTSIIKT